MNQVERTSMQVVGPAPSPAIAYPLHPEQLPAGVCSAGRYQLRFARSRDDLRAIQRLRFEVFNLELDEGLDEAFLLGRDEDHFDAHCHHLMVLERESGVVVGTYRFMTAELAKSRGGFYSETEFDFTRMPPEILASGAEIGRACVHADHRSGRVIHLLWRGIARYLAWNQKRFLFGCASVPSTDPAVAFMLRDALRAQEKMHPFIHLDALPELRCEDRESVVGIDAPGLPPLLQSYLSLGAHVASEPALDLAFKVIDFLVVLDSTRLPSAARRSYFERNRWSEA